jgi:hypothetical protein
MCRYDYDISLDQISHSLSLQWFIVYRRQSVSYKAFRTALFLHSAHSYLEKWHIFWSCNVIHHLNPQPQIVPTSEVRASTIFSLLIDTNQNYYKMAYNGTKSTPSLKKIDRLLQESKFEGTSTQKAQ